ncbi:MAG: DUF2007 domain-containing protein [Prevotellaceae bacterium]|jgi:hypothetical protein|nr:DUF2007 domain-containing protein [Prevotellaceae bacterium]
MEKVDNSRTVEIFRGSLWQVELVQGLLETAGIASVVKDGMLGSIAPNLEPDVALLVSEENYEPAMEIIRSRDKKVCD